MKLPKFKCSYCGRKDAPYYWIHTEHDIIACCFCLTYSKEIEEKENAEAAKDEGLFWGSGQTPDEAIQETRVKVQTGVYHNEPVKKVKTKKQRRWLAIPPLPKG